MSECDISAPATEEFKFAVGKGLVEAEHKCNEYYRSMDTSCGKKLNVWNYRHQCIRESLKDLSERYKTMFLSRVIWEYMPIYDKIINCLYILLKQERFDELQKKPEKNLTHYCKSYSIVNTQFDKYDKLYEQCSLFKPEPISDNIIEFRKNSLEKLQDLFGGKVATYSIITFTIHPILDLLTSMTANIVDSQFRLVREDSWTEYIPASDEPLDIPVQSPYQEMPNGIIIPNNRIDSEPKLKVVPKESKK